MSQLSVIATLQLESASPKETQEGKEYLLSSSHQTVAFWDWLLSLRRVWLHQLSLLLFSQSVVSNSLRPLGLQHTRLPCPSPSPRAFSDSHPLSRWCHPTISSSVIPFSSCLQSFPASGSFQMSQIFASGGQNTGVSLQHQSFQWIFRTDLL